MATAVVLISGGRLFYTLLGGAVNHQRTMLRFTAWAVGAWRILLEIPTTYMRPSRATRAPPCRSVMEVLGVRLCGNALVGDVRPRGMLRFTAGAILFV